VAAYPPGQYATFLANHDQNRTRSVLLNDEQAKIAATLQLMSPGVPFIYYGEEIGMQGEKPDENIRRPMQWDETGGFSTAVPWHPYFEDFPERNVVGQSANPNSLLNHYRALIQLRNNHAALRSGGWLMVETDQKSMYAFLRFNDEEAILILVNLGRKAVDNYNLSLAASPMSTNLPPTLLMGSGELQPPALNDSGGFNNYQPLSALPPYSSFIIRFGE
jgi:glycosidase